MMSSIELNINGSSVSTQITATDTLLEILRRLGFVEVKYSCGRGECGVCAVELNGRVVNACMTLAADCHGAIIRTAKAFGTIQRPGRVQKALCDCGGVQCGYCVPGFVTAAENHLASNPDSCEDDIVSSLDGHLCRCTGYVKQRQALKHIASGENTKIDTNKKAGAVGEPLTKRDALAMACGSAQYSDDVIPQKVLFIATVNSTESHARVTDIKAAEALSIAGVFHVITCFDLPPQKPLEGPTLPTSMLGDNYLLTDKPRFIGDRIAAVLAESEVIAQRAAKKVRVSYEPLPSAVTVEEALAENGPKIGEDGNLVSLRQYKRVKAKEDQKGQEVKAEVEAIIPAARPCFSEPYSCLTYFDASQRLVIQTSTQVPYFVRWIVSLVCSIPVSRIRVIKPQVGGGFGAKQDVVVEALCALATIQTGQAVRFVLDRQAVFRAGRHRHPANIYLQGEAKDGVLDKLVMDVTLDKGAYPPHGASLLLCCASRSLPMYPWREIEFSGRSVLTNKPSAGGLRGYGGPQSVFAIETLVDELAVKANICPLQFRLDNVIGKGSSLNIINELAEQDNVVPETLAGDWPKKCLEKGADLFKWHEKRMAYKDKGRFRRGVGLAWAMQAPSSFAVMRSSATIQLNEDGTFRVISGAADIGTGAETILAQMAAETLGVDVDNIQVITGDTDPTPYDAGAYASSTTWNAGGAVTIAGKRVREEVLSLAAKVSGMNVEELEMKAQKVVSTCGKWQQSLAQLAMEAIRSPEFSPIAVTVSHGPRSIPPSFNAQFLDLVVDTQTGLIKVEKVLSVVDCGQPINPTLCEGQMEGAIAMGLGMALTEELLFNSKGVIVNNNFSTYQLQRMAEIPPIEVEFVKTADEGVPFHAKSIGEIGCMPVMAAVGNALAHATGLRLTNPPFTPWKVLAALNSIKE